MSTSQWWPSRFTRNLTATTYSSVLGGHARNNTGPNATETNASTPCPIGGNLLTLRVVLSAAPGAGQSRTFTIYQNGGSTSATVTISNAATVGTWTGTVAVTAGDLLSLQNSASAGASGAEVTAAIEFSPTTDNYFAYPVVGNGAINAADWFSHPLCGSNTAQTSGMTTYRRMVMPCDGTIRALACSLLVAPGAGTSWTFGIYKNGADVGSTLNIADAATSGLLTGLAITFSRGDTISVHVVAKNGAAATSNWNHGVVIEPSTAKEFLWAGINASSFTVDEYAFQQTRAGSSVQISTTESDVQFSCPANNLSILGLGVELSTTPAGGTTVDVTERIAGASGNVTVHFTSADAKVTTRNVAVHDDLAQGSLVNLLIDITGSVGSIHPLNWAVSVIPTGSLNKQRAFVASVIG